MDSPLIKSSNFPPVKTERKGFIPIRSIPYKKSLADKKDLELRQDMLKTMGKFAVSPLNSEYTNSPTRASTTFGFKSETPNYKPHMNSTFHKLSLSSAKNSTRKPFAGLLPNLKTPQLRSQPTFSQQHLEPKLQRMASKSAGLTAQDDYFKLLFDNNRKVFRVEDVEGVDEYYTDQMIMTRIYNQGFREPEYYSTRIQHTEMQVLDEQTIRDEYRFKIPPVVSTLENTSTLAAHVLGGAWNDMKFIESVCETAHHEMKLIKAQKKELEDQIASLKKKFEDEINTLTDDFSKKFEKLQSVIKEDFIANQNDNFKYQKEIMLLKRDKLNIEKEIENSVPALHRVEDALFGRVLFNLEINDGTLESIPNMNLRAEQFQSMKNGQVIH